MKSRTRPKNEEVGLGETGCNQILARFLLVKSPTKGLNVLKIPIFRVPEYRTSMPLTEYSPFREVTPIAALS
jgi:hypothetical protein